MTEQDFDSQKSKWQEFADENPDKVEENQENEGISYESHEELEQALNTCERALAEHKEAAIRAKADADNIRRRAERDVQNAYKFSNEKILLDLLPVMDSLVRGLEGAATVSESQVKVLQDGMALTLDILKKSLEKHGVKAISPEKGAPFDPAQHEAMSMQPVPGAAPNTIVQVLQDGYELNGRVIRAAMVMSAA